MSDRTAEIETYKGADFSDVENDIARLVNEYDCELVRKHGQDEAKRLMFAPQSMTFKGLLKYIYINLFKLRKDDIKYNNRNSRIDYADIELIDRIWNIYTSLCYERNQKPTILNFSVLTGISRDSIDVWKNGVYRNGEDGATSAHCHTVKKWYQECESGLVDSAMTGNPGGMFLLKASFGYTEQPQRIEIAAAGGPAVSMQELDELRKQHLIAPEKPEL